MSILNSIAILIAFLVQLADKPTFKGGNDQLAGFLANNQIYPSYSKNNCLQGRVTIAFKLTSSGKVFDATVEKGLGLDLDDEALRLVKLTSGKWTLPTGYDTTQTIILPISFSLSEYKCEQRTKDQIKEAIAAYKGREALSQAVINFYTKKNENNSDAGDELAIISIKEELGLDDRYFSELLKQARKKLKQGDKEAACKDFTLISNFGSKIADQDIEKFCK